MKLPITVLLCTAGALACSHQNRSQPAHSVAASPARYETAQVSEYAPPAPGIPTNAPQVPPPATLTPASGVGSARTTTAQLVPTNAERDRPDSVGDQESIREIRALLAADRSLASSAAQVTIVARSGRVWLRGQVNTAQQRAAIERAARQAVGVIDVHNELVALE